MSAAVQSIPDRQPAAHAIPGDAVAAHELAWSRTTAWAVFQRLLAEGRAWQDVAGTRYFDRRHPLVLKHLAKEAGIADDAWQNAPPEAQREALSRCRFIERVELSATKYGSIASRKEVYRRACINVGSEVLGYVVPLPTFYDWRRRYESAGRRRSALMDKRGRTGVERTPFDRDAWAYFESLWLTTQRRRVKSCWRDTATKAGQMGWAWPDYTSVCRRVRMEWPDQKSDYYRLGERAWRMKHAPKLVRDKRDLPGNHTWEIDHLRMDFWARMGKQRKRLWCSLVIDRASNMPVGWAITTNPSSDSLALALRRAVKNYGAPLEATLDNGRDMESSSFGGRKGWLDEQWAGGIFDQMGVKLHWCRPFTPWAKGQVEAMARTIHDEFDRRFESYCGGSTANKPEGIDKWCSEHFSELPTLSDVESLFAQFVQTFAERPSDADGVKPLSPRQRFEQTRIAKRTLPEYVLDVLLLKITGPRNVTAKGVMFHGLHYTDDGGRMFEHQGKEVRLRIDPDDISYAWVCDMKGAPLFIARQNFVKGTADDVRAGQNRRKQAKRVCRDAKLEQYAALDDAPMSILRAQAERYREENAQHEPAIPVPAPSVTPIVTPAAQAIAENAASIRRVKTQDTLRRAGRPMLPTDPGRLTEDDLRSLASGSVDDLAARDDEELAELCG